MAMPTVTTLTKLLKQIFSVVCILCSIYIIFLFVIDWQRDGTNQFDLLIAALLLMVISRFHEIAKLTLNKNGIEAEMQQTIAEAKATISDIQSLALTQGKLALNLLHAHGRYGGGMTFEQKNKLRSEILDNLHLLGISTDKLKQVTKEEERYVLADYLARATNKLPTRWSNETNERNTRWSAFWQKWNAAEGSIPTPDELENFISSLDFKTTDDDDEKLKDYRYYYETRKHRRPSTTPIIGAK